MHVVATAGHVDHGKSTLVRALTGIEPDRWAEERRRGLTIDLGFAWTVLASGREVAFVDVPGHERFLANMLAGLGPAPVVCFVVAADEGWRRQSSDHRDAVAALGIEHGLIVVTRADLAPGRVDDVVAQARAELSGTGLRAAPAVAVSAVDGRGLDELRVALDGVLAAVPPAPTRGRIRLWVDRSFTVAGAGTVVTGTLSAGTIAPGDRLHLLGDGRRREVTVRSAHSRGQERAALVPVDRAGLNLRGVEAGQVQRGDVLVTPDAWHLTETLDVRRASGPAFTGVSDQVSVHVGTAAVAARLRPLGDEHARLTLARALPLAVGDRLVVRYPTRTERFGGAVVLDADPPALHRRGDGQRRTAQLATMSAAGDLSVEVSRRRAARAAQLDRLGLDVGEIPYGMRVIGSWLVDDQALAGWQAKLTALVDELHHRDPLAPGLSQGAAVDALGLPDPQLLAAVAVGLEFTGGYLRRPGHRGRLGPAEAGIATLEQRLHDEPFRAPEADELTELGLGTRELAAAERAGRIVRLDEIVLLPDAPERARQALAGLAQPFTTAEARAQLQTTRRVVIPLLEHLDQLGWTRRLDATHRELTATLPRAGT